MWLSNIAPLFGAELNSEVERSRQLRAGLPATSACRPPAGRRRRLPGAGRRRRSRSPGATAPGSRCRPRHADAAGARLAGCPCLRRLLAIRVRLARVRPDLAADRPGPATLPCVAKRSVRKARAREAQRPSQARPAETPQRSRSFWLGALASAAVLLPLAVIAVLVLGGGDDPSASGSSAAQSAQTEDTAEELRRRFAARDKQQIEELTSRARTMVEDFTPVVAGLAKTLPPDTDEVGPLASAEEVDDWLGRVRGGGRVLRGDGLRGDRDERCAQRARQRGGCPARDRGDVQACAPGAERTCRSARERASTARPGSACVVHGRDPARRRSTSTRASGIST